MIYPSQASSRKWRVLDITVTSVIAVASGVVFWMWDWVCMAPLTLFENITPGFEGLLNGFWLFAGPLAAVIVRKPGAALYAETVAAFLELTLGNQWGVGGSLIVGLHLFGYLGGGRCDRSRCVHRAVACHRPHRSLGSVRSLACS